MKFEYPIIQDVPLKYRNRNPLKSYGNKSSFEELFLDLTINCVFLILTTKQE